MPLPGQYTHVKGKQIPSLFFLNFVLKLNARGISLHYNYCCDYYKYFYRLQLLLLLRSRILYLTRAARFDYRV